MQFLLRWRAEETLVATRHALITHGAYFLFQPITIMISTKLTNERRLLFHLVEQSSNHSIPVNLEQAQMPFKGSFFGHFMVNHTYSSQISGNQPWP